MLFMLIVNVVDDFSYKRMSKSVVLISSLERFPGAETIIILRSGSSLTIFNTF